jgi:hypothetical protein
MLAETRLVAQLTLAIVFALSAGGKLCNPKAFAQGVMDYNVIPELLAYPSAFLIIALEIFLAIAHFTGYVLATAVPLGLLMLLTFLVAVGVNLRRGHTLPCHCFGAHGDETISGQTLSRLLLLLGGEALLVWDRNLFSTPQVVYPDRIASVSELALALFWATFFVMAGSWVLTFADLLDLLRGRKHKPRQQGA